MARGTATTPTPAGKATGSAKAADTTKRGGRGRRNVAAPPIALALTPPPTTPVESDAPGADEVANQNPVPTFGGSRRASLTAAELFPELTGVAAQIPANPPSASRPTYVVNVPDVSDAERPLSPGAPGRVPRLRHRAQAKRREDEDPSSSSSSSDSDVAILKVLRSLSSRKKRKLTRALFAEQSAPSAPAPREVCIERNIDYKGLGELDVSRRDTIDQWFVGFESRCRAADIDLARWTPKFMACTLVPEYLKAELRAVPNLASYAAMRKYVLERYGPPLPVAFWAHRLSEVRGKYIEEVRPELDRIRNLYNRAVALEVTQPLPLTNKDLCWHLIGAFPAADAARLATHIKLAAQHDDPYAILCDMAPSRPLAGTASLASTVALAVTDSSSALRARPSRPQFQRPPPGPRLPPASRPPPPKDGACRGCGRACQSRQSCPAWGKTCDSCGAPNHFSSVCMKRRTPGPAAPSPPANQPLFALNPASAARFYCLLGGRVSTAIADTGATLSFITEPMRLALGIPDRSYAGPTVQLANGALATPTRCVDLSVRVGPITATHELAVLPNIPGVDAIIGLDFLERHGVSVHPARRELQFDTWPGLRLRFVADYPSAFFRATEDITVPPRSLAYVPTELVGDPLHSSAMTIRAAPLFEEARHLLCPQGFVDSSVRELCLQVTNVGGKPRYIPRGCLVAMVEPADESQVHSVGEEDPLASVNVGPQLSGEQRGQLLRLLARYRHCFATAQKPMGRAHRTAHAIDTGDAYPISQHPRPTAPANRAIIKEQVDKMLDEGIIRPSQSPWSSPVVLQRKKDGSTRFCVDYRKLNDVTKKDVHPLPRISDMLEALAGARWFTTLDAASGYWQIPMALDSIEKTAFTCYLGLFEYLVMPFGLCNAPATFQRLMNLILAGLTWNCCLVYLDDIIIMSRTFEEHLVHIEAVLTRLTAEGILLKPVKCHFALNEVAYLGHIVSKDGVRPNPEKVAVLQNFPVPTNLKELQAFLGLAGYYRRFVHKFSIIAGPLFDLLRSDVEFKWSNEQQEAMNALISALVNATTLAHPDSDLPYILDTDASEVGISAVLAQLRDGVEYPIAFSSRRIAPAERKWHIREKEALAIIYGLQQYRHFLLGANFEVRSDHDSLRVLRDAKSGRLARWAMALGEFGPITIRHRSGTKHSNVDAFTRIYADSELLPENAAVFTATGEEGPRMPSPDEIRKAQSEDPKCGNYARSAGKGNIVYDNGILAIRDGSTLKPIIPRTLLPAVVRAYHAPPHHAHLGAARVFSKLRDRFLILGGRAAIQEEISNCLTCQRRKANAPRVGQLASQVPEEPWETVAMDFGGPYSRTNRENAYILVCIDHFSKWVELIPCVDQKAPTVAQALYDYVICRHGCPKRLLSDNGPQFRSELLQQVCDMFGIQKIFASAYYPQGDGTAERFMRTMNNSLATLTSERPDEWDTVLPAVAFAYNSTPSAATAYSPFCVLHGREPRFPEDNVLRNARYVAPDYPRYVEQLREVIRVHQKAARAGLQEQWDIMKRRYDRLPDVKIRQGDYVLVRLTKQQREAYDPPKLAPRWSAPSLVLEALPNGKTFRVLIPDQGERTVHATLLLPTKSTPDICSKGRLADEPLPEGGDSVTPQNPSGPEAIVLLGDSDSE
jgi:transposase InsO family protein